MRRLLQVAVSLMSLMLLAHTARAQGDITSAAPVVNQGATFQFTAGVAGTWACSGTTSTGSATSCAGSINSSSGLYTAPASISNQQYAGGMQLMPNNHIYNTRIDTLPLRSDSATLIAGAGTSTLNYLVFAPANYATGATPTEAQTFFYTTSNNGSFQIPAYPNLKIENGYFSARTYNPFNVDHHMLVMDTSDGTMQEMYQYYPAGANGSCALCTSQSGVRYKNYSYALPGGGGGTTDAAGLYLWPLTLRKQELELAIATSGTINHAIRMTLQNGFLHNAFLWPATASSTSGSGANFYGERVRLKASYTITGFSSIAQIILTQLKQYGMIMADGGAGWQPSAELTRWTKAEANAFQEIQNAAIGPSNFEVVDESALQLVAGSGETTLNREIITFTRTSDSVTSTVDVVLRGVAVNLPADVKYIQAGIAAQQLTAYNNIGTLTWTMSPTVGTLTSGGLYTPPSSATCNQKTTITATSATNANVKAIMQLIAYPTGIIYLVPGQPTDYTDSASHIWCSGETAGGDAGNNFGTESAYGYDNGGSWPSTPDITLYKIPIYALGDIRYDISVANGTYTVTAKLANNNTTDQGNMLLETQGTAGSLLDVFTSVGGNTPLDVTSTVTVSNGILSFVLRPANTVGNGVAPFISALKIAMATLQSPPICGGLNDTAIHTPPSYTLPLAPPATSGASITDPQYGCTITRITTFGEVSASRASTNYYSTVNPLNNDDSLLLVVQSDGNTAIMNFPAGTVAVPQANMPGVVVSDIVWDHVDPKVFYYTTGATFRKGTISGNLSGGAGIVTGTTLHTFTYTNINIPAQEDLSEDGHIIWLVGNIVGTGQTPGKECANASGGFDVAYNLATDTILSSNLTFVFCHKIQTSPSGKMLCTGCNNTGADVHVIYNTNGTLDWTPNTISSHADMGRDLSGNEVLLQVANGTSAVNGCADSFRGMTVINMDTHAVENCLINNIPDWHVGYHTDPSHTGWVILSTWDSAGCGSPGFSCFTLNAGWATDWTARPYYEELVLAKIDGSAVYRLAHTRSRSGENYNAQTHASISRDGKWIIYSSNFDISTNVVAGGDATYYVDVYAIRLANIVNATAVSPKRNH